jgi:hypothetical protein
MDKEIICCKICFEKFDSLDRKPIIMMMCCHTICNNCINDLKTMPNYYCPTCRQPIISEKPKYIIVILNIFRWLNLIYFNFIIVMH